MKINETNFFLKIFSVILLFIFSLMLGIFLESLRFHVVGYYEFTKIGMPSSTEFIMNIHSNSKDFFPKYYTFLHIMLIPCLFIICLNYKSFSNTKNKEILIINCLLGMMFNLTITIFITLLIADPICSFGVLPDDKQLYSPVSMIFGLIVIILILTSVILLSWEFFRSFRSCPKPEIEG